MASPSVTYTFSNLTTSDATQVNQNFQDIINALTDGTKDISISAFSAAGNATFAGNVTLGSASADDVTFNGALASSIPVKTTATYDIGSATLGLRAIYLGANSQTVKIQGSSSMSATYTFTLPVSAGTVGMFLRTDGSATTSWAFKEKTTTKTTTYTATADESIILASTSGSAWTLTLPPAGTYTHKDLLIKKTDSSSNWLTIDGDGSETIDGSTSTTLCLQYESIRIASDGSNWHILNRTVPGVSFRVYRGSAQAITSSSTTKVQFNTKEFDLYSFFDASTNFRYQPLIPGKFAFFANVNFVSGTDQKTTSVFIYKNGNPVKVFRTNTSWDQNYSLSVPFVVDLNGTSDYIEVYCLHTSGGIINIDNDSLVTSFEGFLVSRTI